MPSEQNIFIVTMRDPSVLGVAAIPTTDDALLVEADDVSVVLPRFWPLWLLEIRAYAFFTQKLVLQPIIYLKHL